MSEEAKTSGRLISIFGTPSGYLRFASLLLHNMLATTVKNFDHVAASELQHLRAALSKRRHPNFLLLSDCPERSIVDVYLNTQTPVLVVFEDPEDVATDLIRERGIEPTWAVRYTEQSLTTLDDLIRSDQALIMPRERRIMLADFLIQVAEHFSLPLADADLEIIARKVAPKTQDALTMSMEDLYQLNLINLNPNGQSAFNPQVLAPFEPIFERLRRLLNSQTDSEINWPIFMLMEGDAPKSTFDGSLDLTGPARCIVYGPYMCLPYGSWGLRASITINENRSGNELEIDVYQSSVLVRNRFPLPLEGDLEIRAQFKNSEPRVPLQLRLITAEGAIEGRITVNSITLIKLEDLSE